MFRLNAATTLLIAIASLLLPGCAAPKPATPAAPDPDTVHLESFFILSSAPARGSPTPVVVLLPGASGLKIFDDTQHYHRAAQELNAAGYDTIIVDYKTYTQLAEYEESNPPGRRAFLGARDALHWAKVHQKIDPKAPVALVAWSAGARGVWHTVGTQGFPSMLNVVAAATYYPVTPEAEYHLFTFVPLLILAGESDDVCTAKDIRAFVATNDTVNGDTATLHVYPDARHGFDVESIAKRRKISLIPLIGPSATFQYNKPAADAARSELLTFLNQHLRTPNP